MNYRILVLKASFSTIDEKVVKFYHLPVSLPPMNLIIFAKFRLCLCVATWRPSKSSAHSRKVW